MAGKIPDNRTSLLARWFITIPAVKNGKAARVGAG